MRQTIFFILILFTFFGQAQVSINSVSAPAHNSAMLDITSNQKGMLLPRMTLAERNLIPSPANSLLIYQTDNNAGYYYNAGTSASPNWQAINAQSNGFKIPINSIPITISSPGSYIVTGNLSGTGGINITSSNVSIDLNFYSLTGSVGNTTAGIKANGSLKSINVFNGTIQNWSESGIDASSANACQFANIHVIDNGEDGLSAGTSAIISNITSNGNDFNGLTSGAGSNITLCSAKENGGTGIDASASSTISQCNSSSNNLIGIKIGNGSVISGSTSNGNLSHGISTGTSVKINNCTSYSNMLSGFFLGSANFVDGNVARLNSRHGYETTNDVTLKNNLADDNAQNGFHSTFSGGVLESNVSTDNAIGYNITSTSWLITKNSASTNVTSQFSIAGGNTVGPIVTSANIGTNNNPNANFEF